MKKEIAQELKLGQTFVGILNNGYKGLIIQISQEMLDDDEHTLCFLHYNGFKEKPYQIIRKIFQNKERNRYYGLRIGDIVKLNIYREKEVVAEVVGYGDLDNNRIIVKMEDGSIEGEVAEWCTVLIKVEDRKITCRKCYGKLIQREYVGVLEGMKAEGLICPTCDAVIKFDK